MHPAAKMLVDLANAQDIEAGDGTTSVVVIAGSLLGAAERLLAKGASSKPWATRSTQTDAGIASRTASNRDFGVLSTSRGPSS